MFTYPVLMFNLSKDHCEFIHLWCCMYCLITSFLTQHIVAIFTSPEILPVIYIYLSHTLLPLSLNSLKKFFFIYIKALPCYLLCFSQLLLISLLFPSLILFQCISNFMNKIFNFHIMKYISFFLYDICVRYNFFSSSICDKGDKQF